MTPAADRVRGWARDWIYVRDGSPTVDTAEYLLVAHPLTWSDPTGVFRIHSDRPPRELVDEVVAAAAGLGRTSVTFWTQPGMRPAGLVEELTARGGELHEELAVLARLISGDDLPDLGVPDDVEIRLSTDLATQRDFDQVGVDVFGGSPVAEAELQADLDRRDAAAGAAFVAYRDGVPVGSGGVTFADQVARLWGGSVVEAARGTGVYRALLAGRLTAGLERGCRAALVKGRLETSAPILRRAGFVAYGEERGYRLSWT